MTRSIIELSLTRIIVFTPMVFSLFLVQSNAETSNTKDVFYPPYWDLAPSSLADYPLVNDSLSPYRLIDPWYYPHRLGLYKILINITTPYMPFCSSSNASNILFALPSQFGWLFRSNRLFTNGSMNISTASWWASANYYLSVIPFLVAADVELLSLEPFRIVQVENFCFNSPTCFEQIPKAMTQWEVFFLQLQQSTACIANRKINERTIDECFLKQSWLAYKSSIFNALPLVESKLNYLPSETEKLFGLAWSKLINLISMTRKNTDLYETIHNQQRFLPFRILNESDRSDKSNDLPWTVRKSLSVLFSFRFDWLPIIEKIWQRITCNYDARISAQRALDNMALSKFTSLWHLTKAIINAFLYECDR